MSFGEVVDLPLPEQLPYLEDRPFVPSFSVMQHVIVNEEILGAHDELKRGLRTEKKSIHGHVIPPEDLCLIHLDQQALIVQLEQPGLLPKSKRDKRFLTEDIESAAHSVRLSLSQLMQHSPEGMNLPVTEPRFYQGGGVIGVGSYGWQGFKAKYGQPANRADKMNHNQVMKTINQICLGSLAGNLSGLDRLPLDMSALLSEPHIPLLKLAVPLPKKRFTKIQGIVESALPEVVTLSDPIISLHLVEDQPPEILAVWPRHEVGGKLRLFSKAA